MKERWEYTEWREINSGSKYISKYNKLFLSHFNKGMKIEKNNLKLSNGIPNR